MPVGPTQYYGSPQVAIASAATSELLNNVRIASRKLTAYQVDMDTGKVF